MTLYNKCVIAFESAATKKGYCFDKDSVGSYEDIFLQEAWEIFISVNFKSIS